MLVDSDIVDTMQAEVIVEEIMGLARPQYILRDLCRVIDMGDALEMKATIATALAGNEKVPQMVEAPLAAQAYTPVNVVCWKNVVHVAISLEASHRAKQNVWQMHLEDAAKDIARMENSQIATELETNTGVAGTDWGTATNNPLVDIGLMIAAIENNTGYTATGIAMNSVTYADLIGNPFVTNAFERGTIARTGRLPAILGLTLRVAQGLTSNIAIILDKNSPNTLFADGPMAIENYTGRGAFFKGYAVAKFQYPTLVLAASGRKLTGL